MARFIDCDDGAVNLDHVMRVHVNVAGVQLLYGINDVILGTISRGNPSFEDITARVVAAAPGMNATVITISTVDGKRPTVEDAIVEEIPIIAWKISAPEPQAILMRSAYFNETVLHPMPGGKLSEPYSGDYDDLHSALDSLLRRAQREWDSEHTAIAAD